MSVMYEKCDQHKQRARLADHASGGNGDLRFRYRTNEPASLSV